MDTTWSALLIDDDPGLRQSVRLCLEADDVRVLGVGTAAGALEALERARFDVVFLDLWLKEESGLAVLPEILRRQPGISVIVITAYATFETAVEAMTLGAVDYLPKPFTPEQVRNTARRVVAASVLKRQLSELRDRLDHAEEESFFVTHSPAFHAFLQTALRAARSDTVVLLRGESGTGKNVLARWMRQESPRAGSPFVTVHCPMLAGDLMSSALFGHRKGAFTGAVTDTVGKVEEARGGTLFLDEVGDLTPDAQARLLRFLNDRTYERLGEAKERKADVRLLAATNRPLEEAVKSGRLRLERVPVDVFAVVGRAIEVLRPRFEDAEIAVEVLRACPTAMVHGDPARLGIVLSNVLTNALKYTTRGGRVTIRVSSRRPAADGQGETVQIAVTDTGRGIPEEFRERVFEKFFRVEHHRRNGAGGTRGAGIGLYLCRQIIEAHGGSIRCEAGEAGSGTRIAIEIAIELKDEFRMAPGRDEISR